MGRENKVHLKEIINGDKDFTYNNERIKKLIVDILVDYFKKKHDK